MTNPNKNFLDEIKQRKVMRALVVYSAAAFALLQFVDIAAPRLGLPDRTVDLVLWGMVLGLPIAGVLSWFFDIRKEPGNESGPRWFSTQMVVAALLLVAVGIGAGWWAGSSPASEAPPQITISPLTSQTGLTLSGSWSPDGSQFAYDYTLNGSMDIAVRPVAGGQAIVVASGPNDDALPRWSPDGSRIAFLSDDGTGLAVYTVPATGGSRRKLANTNQTYLDSFTTLISLGAQPWSPDSSELVFSRQTASEVALFIVDTETLEERQLTQPEVGQVHARAAWSNDGEWIAYIEFSAYDIYRIPAAGGEAEPLLVNDDPNTGLAWSNDDSKILFTVARTTTGGGDIWDLDLESKATRQLTNGATLSSPVLSSTGRIVVAQWSHDASFSRIRMAAPDVDEQISLSTGENYAPSYSPDGRTIVFQSARSGRSELWLHDLETGSEQLLTRPPDGKQDRTPGWSPDGSQVVFLSDRGDPFQLWIVNADGSNPHRISEQQIPMTGDWWVLERVAPRWAADGSVIAYLAPGAEGLTLWLIEPDGSNARATDITGVLRYDWYVDSRHVIYTRNKADGSGQIEMIAADLVSGEEVQLLDANATELDVTQSGNAVAYNSADSHFSMNRWILLLERPAGTNGLPVAVGQPEQITFGQGIWHVHGGAWSPNGEEFVFTKDFDSGNLFVIDGYK